MRLQDFDYNLPKELIAQEPIKPRDHSRLLALHKTSGAIEHKHFYDIVDYFKKGDVLVLNNSKVFPARLIGKKAKTGGEVEVFLLKKEDDASCPASQQLSQSCCALESRQSSAERLPRGESARVSEGSEPPVGVRNPKLKVANFNGEFGTRSETASQAVLPPAKSCLTVSQYCGTVEHLDRANEIWQCLLGGRVKEGAEIEFAGGLKCVALENNNDGAWQVGFNKTGKKLMDIVFKIGKMPLPPYIKQIPNSKSQTPNYDDKVNYQTIYANNNKVGSAAAPTAGFHFTPELIKKLKTKGVQFVYVTLHVGLGTFLPVKAEDITKHKMHSEWVEVKKDAIERIIKAKEDGRRVIAVGTTSVRTLESLAARGILPAFRPGFNGFSRQSARLKPREPELKLGRRRRSPLIAGFSGWTDIFIYPGYEFKIIDGMITNFHLPKSTLLMLVSALAGKELIDKAYKIAINKKYRFYSYGDAMLILNG